MIVSPISSRSIMYGGMQKTKLLASDAANAFQQTLSIEADKIIDLGTIDGKPFNMKVFQDGGHEWSGNLRINLKDMVGEVTPEQHAIARAARLYTRTEWKKGDQISAVIGHMYRMIDQQEACSSFNEYIKSARIPLEAVEDAFNCLGLDVSEPFTINDRTFIWNSNNLKDYEEGK